MYKPAMLLVSLLVALVAPYAGALECPAVPAISASSPEDLAFEREWKGVAEPYSARDAVENAAEEPPYGIGYLLVQSDHYYDWPREITLPLWTATDEKTFFGWIRGGRVYPSEAEAPYVLTGVGMVETDYEQTSFIVWETSDNGWLRLKLKPGKAGELWTHQCHLAMGKAKLVYENWESFLKKHGDWLHFRVQVPHSLREQPDANSQRVTTIGLDHKLILLELKGDWMRVKVQQPDWTCSGLSAEEFKGSTHEGWVRWRDDKMGPWVWVYTRGC